MNSEEFIGKKVRVYRNLHKQKFSVVDIKTGRVIFHTISLALKNVTFKVRENGRLKVLETKQKNVHAFVCGVISEDDQNINDYVGVSYNPYFKDSFYIKSNNKDIKDAFFVKLDNGKDILAKID